MPVEFIGFIGAQHTSETHPPKGPALDVDYVEKVAKAHDAGGFDRALVAFGSTSPESILVVAHAASVTEKLGFMIAHRPGFTAPTIAARQLATLDHFSKGRIAVHIITGGSDAEMAKDGDHTNKAERYARTDEYLDIVKQEWTSAKPFDYKGNYYNVIQGFGSVKPLQQPHIPIYFGGSSDEAIPVAGKHADIFALWGETQAQVRETIARVRAAAAKHGRDVKFSLSLRPVIADTEDAAWKRADDIVARTLEVRKAAGLPTENHAPVNAGSQRLLQAAAQGTRLDKRLWTGVAAVTGASGNSTGLVGTPDQVAEALLDYYDLGVSTFLIRGFDPLDDAIGYGRDLIPRVRELVAQRDAHPIAAAG
ncbi:LLM class flavin-dependent oxidoreductase [Phenylobacterium aquaticum]|uniref:LLM class flavin-dependent oxidoreductase n=1 Tax=Phenylobacterium aquaticum TaxID=1763816 RepID=UPI0026EF9F9E|nr:LLM class flavin-dependent oxidoreductase [Phenylobacterium aquaticum]